MSPTASRSRAKRSLKSGHLPSATDPTAISLSASPEPTPRNTRPGARQPRVANSCATTAGLYRKVGVSTDVPRTTRSVRAATKPSHASALGACPPVSRHGWKWSLIVTESSPTSSANTAYAASSPGANCSADALYPMRMPMPGDATRGRQPRGIPVKDTVARGPLRRAAVLS